MESIFGILALVIVGYSASSLRIINESNEALVERLGRYNRKLKPGLNFVVPVLDKIVLTETLREQILDIKPQTVITKNNVTVQADAVVYWRILDLERTYYEIENVEKGIEELGVTTLRSEIGKMDLEDTFSSRETINKALIEQLDEATDPWGVKIMRVEVQEIKPPQDVIESMQQQQAAQMKKRAVILEAEGQRAAEIARAEGTVKSIEQLANTFQRYGDSKEILQYLIAQRYVEANQKLGESDNSKVVFMDPKLLTEGLIDLMETRTDIPRAPAEDEPPAPPNHKWHSGRS